MATVGIAVIEEIEIEARATDMAQVKMVTVHKALMELPTPWPLPHRPHPWTRTLQPQTPRPGPSGLNTTPSTRSKIHMLPTAAPRPTWLTTVSITVRQLMARHSLLHPVRQAKLLLHRRRLMLRAMERLRLHLLRVVKTMVVIVRYVQFMFTHGFD
jgi:hypothetical protein